MSEARRRRPLFIAACAGIFVFGVVLAILGTLFGLDGMRERLGIDLAQQGDVFLALFFGVLIATLFVGPLTDRFGGRAVLTTSAALVAVALASFAEVHAYWPAVAAAFVLGIGGGGLNTATNALVASLYTDTRGAMLAILGTFFGVGALVIPLTAASLTGTFTISQLLFGTAALAGACALLFVPLSFPPHARSGSTILGSLRAARMPGVPLFAAILFCQSGNESAIGGWTSTYAATLGAPPRAAIWVLTAYWAALMLGRLASASIQRHVSHAHLVSASGVGSAIGSLILLTSTSIAALAAGAIVLGLSFAAVYPTTLAMAADRYEAQAGTVFGFLFAVGLIGGMLFPWAVGHISQAIGMRPAMLMPLLSAAAISVLALRVRPTIPVQ
jgi:fucose permease